MLLRIEMPTEQKEFLIKRLGDIGIKIKKFWKNYILEYRLSINCSEKVQSYALVASFAEVRNIKIWKSRKFFYFPQNN